MNRLMETVSGPGNDFHDCTGNPPCQRKRVGGGNKDIPVPVNQQDR